MEYDRLYYGPVNMYFQYSNLAIAIVTNIACVYVFTVMTYWWWRLRLSDTNLRPLILGIAFAKLGIWFWSFTAIMQLVYFDMTLPYITMPARIFIMLAALLHVYVTTRIKPAPKAESLQGPFE